MQEVREQRDRLGENEVAIKDELVRHARHTRAFGEIRRLIDWCGGLTWWRVLEAVCCSACEQAAARVCGCIHIQCVGGLRGFRGTGAPVTAIEGFRGIQVAWGHRTHL